MSNKISQINLFDGKNLEGFGTLGKPTTDPFTTFNLLMSSIIGLITVVAFLWLMFLVITSAIGIMNSAGDKAALQKNTTIITNALIGILVLFLSLYIINLVGYLLGFGDIVLNPANAVKTYLQL